MMLAKNLLTVTESEVSIWWPSAREVRTKQVSDSKGQVWELVD